MNLFIGTANQLTQLRNKNRQIVLRTVYVGLANTRADLAEVTGLTKPTVAKVASQLIEEGYLVESGFGESTEEGGPRPRLLEFVPDVRHVIGVALTNERISAVLANLQGKIVMQHYANIGGLQGEDVLKKLIESINALTAQLNVPLLCIGVGIPGRVNSPDGGFCSAPHLGWENIPLAAVLRETCQVPTYIANSYDLAALAQFAFAAHNGTTSLATVLANEDIGVGFVLNGAIYHSGATINQVRITHPDRDAGLPSEATLEQILGWDYVKKRAAPLQEVYGDPLLFQKLTYLHIRQAVQDGNSLALAVEDTLASYLAQVYLWIITILHPQHLSLAGGMAHLGDEFLAKVVENTRSLLEDRSLADTSFSLDTSPHLVARGAVAQALQHELGLV